MNVILLGFLLSIRAGIWLNLTADDKPVKEKTLEIQPTTSSLLLILIPKISHLPRFSHHTSKCFVISSNSLALNTSSCNAIQNF